MWNIALLLKGEIAENYGDFFFIFYLHSFRTESVSFEKLSKAHYFCQVILIDDDNNILKDKHGAKMIEILFEIYADLENNFENASYKN